MVRTMYELEDVNGFRYSYITKASTLNGICRAACKCFHSNKLASGSYTVLNLDLKPLALIYLGSNMNFPVILKKYC